MNQDTLKQMAAKAAIEHIPFDEIIGIGTGSTTNYFIDELAAIKHRIKGVVASSIASAKRLQLHGIEVLDLNQINEIAVYIDGADEANEHRHLIKGGGGALTREKIITAASKQFICIMDESKLVPILGAFPLPIEVIPMAQSLVAREVVKLTGGYPVLRERFATDNGNIIIDIHGLQITDARTLEQQLNAITGVVTNGLFALKGADLLLLADENGVRTI